MSQEQREAIKSWSTNAMKIMLGVSSFALVGMYTVIEKNRDYERDEFKKTIEKIEGNIEKIESNTDVMSKDVSTIKNSVDLIEYRLDQVEERQ